MYTFKTHTYVVRLPYMDVFIFVYLVQCVIQLL